MLKLLAPYIVEQPVERVINNCQLRVEFPAYRFFFLISGTCRYRSIKELGGYFKV